MSTKNLRLVILPPGAMGRSTYEDTTVTPAGEALLQAIAGGTAPTPSDAELAAIAGLSSGADEVPYFTGVGAAALATFTTAGRALVDDADAAAQRATLGLGTAATTAATAYAAVAQSVAKSGITPAGTAVVDIPTRTNDSSFLRVYVDVFFTSSSDLRALLEITIGREGGSQMDGGAIVRVLSNNSTGNFQVASGNFVVTFPSASVTRITYTSANPSSNNDATFFVEGLGINGTVTIT